MSCVCIACLRLESKEISKLNKLICKYCFCTITSRFYYCSFHIINSDLLRDTAKLFKDPLHTIKETFLILRWKWYGEAAVTKRQCHYQAMNINVFPVFYSFHKAEKDGKYIDVHCLVMNINEHQCISRL